MITASKKRRRQESYREDIEQSSLVANVLASMMAAVVCGVAVRRLTAQTRRMRSNRGSFPGRKDISSTEEKVRSRHL